MGWWWWWGWGPLTKEAYLLTKLYCCRDRWPHTQYTHTHTHTQHTHTHTAEKGWIVYSKKSKQPFKGVSLTSSALQCIGIYLKDNAEMLESKLMIV